MPGNTEACQSLLPSARSLYCQLTPRLGLEVDVLDGSEKGLHCAAMRGKVDDVMSLGSLENKRQGVF